MCLGFYLLSVLPKYLQSEPENSVKGNRPFNMRHRHRIHFSIALMSSFHSTFVWFALYVYAFECNVQSELILILALNTGLPTKDETLETIVQNLC